VNSAESLIMLLMTLSMASAEAKLPPPTPEEQAAVAQKKAAQQAQVEKQQKALEAAQDRVVQRYRSERGGAPAAGGAPGAGGEPKQAGNMPKTTKELPAGVGPTPTQPQSSEAHSGQVK
jgi:hypothetical protein